MNDPSPTPERSALMGRIKGKNTLPELNVRKFLHAQGFRFRLHDRTLPGSPDLVLSSRRIVLFVHGCFWHRHGCHATTTPKTRTQFWNEKFEANKARDKRNEEALLKMGWQHLIVWECEIKNNSFQKPLLSALRAVPLATVRPHGEHPGPLVVS